MVLHQESVPEALAEALAISSPESLSESLEVDAVPTCCHHWIIEMANGPISRGVCQKCSESREFKNSVFGIERDISDTPSREESAAKEIMGAIEE